MNEKLSLQDLVDLLSKKAKITKKDADAFYRELFQLILERIFDNDFVKIKDFGTFKLISVSSRESVNVNTGEKIEIPSHYKLSFIPDKILKNLVNKPFSQFETILLEDGVTFEASVDDNEEDESDDETVENTELEMKGDDDDIVNEATTVLDVETASVISNTKLEVKENNIQDDETPKVSKPKPSANQVYPTSFVYTYTTSTSNQNNGSIILTVPKDELVAAAPVAKVESEIQPSLKDVSEKKEFSMELKDLPDISEVDNELTVDLNEEVVVENETEFTEDIQVERQVDENEQKGDEKELLDEPLLENKVLLNTSYLSKDIIADDIELESDFDSEIEIEEDIIVPVPVVAKISQSEEIEQPLIDEVCVEEKKTAYSNEDPERPLFPSENDTNDDLTHFPQEQKVVNQELDIIEEDLGQTVSAEINSRAGNNKPTEIRSVLFSDTIDPVDIPYADYSNPGGGSKVKKWLPVILFFLVIVGFLAYGLVKMLRKPYDYEYNLGRTNFSLTDTLPLVDEVSPQVQETDALLDSMKRVQHGLVQDTVKPMKQEPIVPIAQKAEVKQEVESVKSNIVGSADSLTTRLIDAEKNSFVISDKLKFGILNKAEYHLQKYANDNGGDESKSYAQSDKSESKTNTVAPKPQYSTIKRGTTLRTMAAAYYGSPDYWVYIYQANKRNIANPNNVPIGTTLLIPPLSDYGISNTKDPKAMQVAKNLETKILRQR